MRRNMKYYFMLIHDVAEYNGLQNRGDRVSTRSETYRIFTQYTFISCMALHNIDTREDIPFSSLEVIQVLRNAVGGGRVQISWKKALQRCTYQRY